MLELNLYPWAVLVVVIAAALAVDLAIFHRSQGNPTLLKAVAESAAWISLALLFNAWIYFTRGPQAGTQFLTAYLVEKSLSADNVLVFLVIFRAWNIPIRRQHRVLYYGVFGALILRGVFIFAGIALLRRIHFLLYVFGAVLLVAGIHLALPQKPGDKGENNWIFRLLRKAIPAAENYDGDAFVVRESGRWKATNLLLALLAIEVLDIVFAVDSVPAVLAISRDAFIVYASNAFAILGLRALYFTLAETLPRIRFFHQSLAAILGFVGFKMILSERLQISDSVSLAVIAAILGVAIGASLLAPRHS